MTLTAATGADPGPNANQCTVNLTGVPNQTYTTVTLNGVTFRCGFGPLNPAPSGTMGLLVGDVSGKGVQAASVTGHVRDVIRVLVADGRGDVGDGVSSEGAFLGHQVDHLREEEGVTLRPRQELLFQRRDEGRGA